METNIHRSTAYIGLGSNQGDSLAILGKAVAELATGACQLQSVSSLYQSEPIGAVPQPEFINAVLSLHTTLSPIVLLDLLQDLEHKHGRIRLNHWGPRTLDLDILFFDQNIINSQRLTLPHPQLIHRAFVLQPLLEIAPDILLPSGQPLTSFLPKTQSQRIHKLPYPLYWWK